MNISFDLWSTLIKANPQYKQIKRELIRKFSDNPSISDEEIDKHIKFVKNQNDNLVELNGWQPDVRSSYGLLCNLVGIPIEKLHFFRDEYIRAFIKIGPLMYSKESCEVIHALKRQGHKLHISSNTAFIPGYALKDHVESFYGEDVFDVQLYSDELGSSKPCEYNFMEGIDWHVGDNVITDGACVNSGIKFFQINSNDKTIGDFHKEISSQGC